MRILHAAGPAHVADVHEPVKALFDFHERAKLRDVANLPGDDRSHGIFLSRQQPGIGLRLLHSQRDAPVAGLDVQHDHVHHVADLRHLRRVLNFFVPAHLRDMHQALDALFQLDEHSVVDDAYDFSLNLAARGIPFRRAYPGIRGQLLQSQ